MPCPVGGTPLHCDLRSSAAPLSPTWADGPPGPGLLPPPHPSERLPHALRVPLPGTSAFSVAVGVPSLCCGKVRCGKRGGRLGRTHGNPQCSWGGRGLAKNNEPGRRPGSASPVGAVGGHLFHLPWAVWWEWGRRLGGGWARGGWELLRPGPSIPWSAGQRGPALGTLHFPLRVALPRGGSLEVGTLLVAPRAPYTQGSLPVNLRAWPSGVQVGGPRHEF